MRILFLHPNLLWKYNNSHQRFRNEIGRHHEVIYVGDGFHGEKGLKYSVPSLVDTYKPDVLMTYSYKYTVPFRGIENVKKTPKVHFVDDLVPSISGYTGSVQPYSRMLLEHKYDLCFGRTTRVVDFVLKHKLCPKAEFLPFSVDTEYFKPNGSDRDIDVSTPMSVVYGVYPNREKVIDAVKKMDINYKVDRVFKNAYVDLLCRSKLMINSVNFWKAVNFKILEGMACGSLVLTDRPKDLDILEIKDREHLLIYDGVPHMVSLIRDYLSNIFETRRIAKIGMDFVRRYHSNSQRVIEMTRYTEAHL